MALPIRTKPSFPLSQSLPSGSFNSLLFFSIRGLTEWNHNHRKLTKLIAWTTALPNSMKLWAMPCRPPKMDRSWQRVLAKRGPLEKGMANHFSLLALRTPWISWKGKKIGHWKVELLRSVGVQYATGDQWRNNFRKNEGVEPKQKQHPVVDGTGNRCKIQCCKEQYYIGTWNVRSMNQGKLEVVKQEMEEWTSTF